VAEGDTLLKLANPELELEYIQREAQIYDVINNLQTSLTNVQQQALLKQLEFNELEYKLFTANDEYERKASVYKSNYITESEFVQLESRKINLSGQLSVMHRLRMIDSISRIQQSQQINGSLIRLHHNLRVLREYLDNLYIKSPAHGVITGFQPEAGMLVHSGQQLCAIDQDERKKVRAIVDEHFIQRVIEGQKVFMHFRGETYTLHIDKIFSKLIEGGYEVDMDFDSLYPSNTKNGQRVQLQIQLSAAEPTLVLKKGSFQHISMAKWVYVINSDGSKASKRKILTGRENACYFEIINGLKAGDKVLISSYETYGNKEMLIFE
jgi:HlyD family secretion protein